MFICIDTRQLILISKSGQKNINTNANAVFLTFFTNIILYLSNFNQITNEVK